MQSLVERLKDFSFFQISIITALTAIGFITLLAFPFQSHHSLFTKKFIHVFISYALFFTLAFQKRKFFYDHAYLTHIIACGLLLVSFFFPKVNNTHRWITLGPTHIQASEFAKITMVLALARYSASTIHHGYNQFTQLLFPLVLIIGLPGVLILAQPDLGTAIAFSCTGLIMLYIIGTHKRFFILLFSLTIGLAPVAWLYILQPYQKQRIQTFLTNSDTGQHQSYQIRQSLIAVGSGGLSGKGWKKGTQTQLAFLPEKHTDFIFAAWAEEFGFLGCLLLIALLLIFIIHAFYVAALSRNSFGVYTSSGLAISIALYSLVNIAMVTGYLPVVGIPLPFISYGGSSLLSSFIAAAIISCMCQHRLSSHL